MCHDSTALPRRQSDRISIFLSSSPPQVRAGLNLVFIALQAWAWHADKQVLDPTLLPNATPVHPLTIEAAPRPRRFCCLVR